MAIESLSTRSSAPQSLSSNRAAAQAERSNLVKGPEKAEAATVSADSAQRTLTPTFESEEEKGATLDRQV